VNILVVRYCSAVSALPDKERDCIVLLYALRLIPAECESVMRKAVVAHGDAKSKREKCRFAGS
jgi:hypothetical protein